MDTDHTQQHLCSSLSAARVINGNIHPNNMSSHLLSMTSLFLSIEKNSANFPKGTRFGSLPTNFSHLLLSFFLWIFWARRSQFRMYLLPLCPRALWYQPWTLILFLAPGLCPTRPKPSSQWSYHSGLGLRFHRLPGLKSWFILWPCKLSIISIS